MDSGAPGCPPVSGPESHLVPSPMGPPPSICPERRVLPASSTCQQGGPQSGLPVWLIGPIQFTRAARPTSSTEESARSAHERATLGI